MRNSYLTRLGAAAAAVIAVACSSSSSTSPRQGAVAVALTDAPFATDSVQSVNIFVTRVDARAAHSDSASADSATTSDSAAAHGWITLATPNKVFDLLTLTNGVSAVLDTTSMAAGSYSSMRMVIDPTRSNVVLKNGMTLNGSSTPGVMFPSGSSRGIQVNFTGGGLNVVAGDTAKVTLDFDVSQSFVLRGNTITQLGLLFKPVIRASVSQ